MATFAFAGKADDIFRTGPEVLTAQSSSIVAGTVSSYAKQVLTRSSPAGPDAIPQTWVVTGRLENPHILKGIGRASITFSRKECSVFLDNQWKQKWEELSGELSPEGRAVLFLSEDHQSPETKAVPSGVGERNLEALVKDFVAIQALNPQAQEAAWITYLERSQTDEGCEAALRSLLRAKIAWDHLSPALDRFLANPKRSQTMRMYTFGIMVYGVTGRLWPRSESAVVQNLCNQFATAPAADEDLLLNYLLQFELLLRYATEEANKAEREPLRTMIGRCLKHRVRSLNQTPDLAEQYHQIHEDYPDLL